MNENNSYDYIIVGQGLAGTWLSWYLLQRQQNILVIDAYETSTASNISSGIINPITGRKLVKTWKIDTLLPFAIAAYTAIEQQLKTKLLHAHNLIWLLSSIQEINNFNGASAKDGYKKFIHQIKMGSLQPLLENSLGFAELQGTLYTDIPKMVQLFRLFLENENRMLNLKLDIEAIDFQENGLILNLKEKTIRAKKIIFCEGYKAIHNPYFKWLPFNLAKGERLLIHCEALKITKKIIKGKVFLVPIGGDKYWVGSTNVWQPIDEKPTEMGKTQLLDRLHQLIDPQKMPYTILDHQAGVRPTTRQRRPFVGLHPTHPQLGIFNGLGTKGASLAPYFAAQFVDFLEGKGKLDKEINIEQYFN